jgi:DNA-binding transcriptional LysR family regulator
MAELSITGLRALREVIAPGSFSAAAERLGYTQSTVSRQIAVIEAAAGGPVFERGNRGVRATELGLVVARHAAAILDQLAAAEHELARRSREPTQRVRPDAFTNSMAALVPAALTRLPELAPRITVTLREGTSPDQLRRLAAGSLDVAVVTGDLDQTMHDHPEVSVEWLSDDPLLLAVGHAHPLAAVGSVSPAELEHEGWIVGSAAPSDGLLGARPTSATTTDPAQQLVRILRTALDDVAVSRRAVGVR